MKLFDRLKKIEAKAATGMKICVVKFQIELTTLEYGDDKYWRLDGETEDDFVERVLAIVKKNPKPKGHYLMGNIC
jgi:hypothetical protein